MVTNSDIPSALFSVYSTPQTNQPILLYQGTVEIQVDSQKIAAGESNIYLNWLPSPSIKVEINNAILDIPEKDLEDIAFSGKVQLLLVDSEVRASAYLDQFSYLHDSSAEDFCRIDIAGNLYEAIWSKSDESLEYILGHLVNFPRLAGNWISHSQENWISEAALRAVLTTERWKITIDGVSNIDEITKELHQSGGYAITSLIKIERSSKSERFTSLGDTRKITDALCFFFSFAVGRYSPVVLPVGFDSSGIESWYEWKDWLIPQWGKTISWFSGKKNWDGLGQVFPGFMKIWDDPIWRESIRRSILWYVESNRTTADPSGSIVLVQSALELLSQTPFISIENEKEEKKSKSKSKQQGGACKKIKDLLNKLHIPVSFSNTPRDLQHLGRFIERYKQNWQSSEDYLYLKAFVEIRNDIVHSKQCYETIPSPDNSDYEDSFWVRVEALNFGLWCLELSLLRLFEYQGSYTNRLKNGGLEAVPWAEVINT